MENLLLNIGRSIQGVVSRMICAHFLTNGDIKCFDQMQNCGLAELDINQEFGTLVYYNRVLA